jgi:tRNA splicing ligase
MRKTNLCRMMDRLKKIGVNLELAGNYPWVYILKINGKWVKESYQSEHGFVLCFSPKETDGDFSFAYGFSDAFKLIRKYTTEREKKLKRILKD